MNIKPKNRMIRGMEKKNIRKIVIIIIEATQNICKYDTAAKSN